MNHYFTEIYGYFSKTKKLSDDINKILKRFINAYDLSITLLKHKILPEK